MFGLWAHNHCEMCPLSLAGIILCMRPANERRRYNVTSSLIGWAHHCLSFLSLVCLAAGISYVNVICSIFYKDKHPYMTSRKQNTQGPIMYFHKAWTWVHAYPYVYNITYSDAEAAIRNIPGRLHPWVTWTSATMVRDHSWYGLSQWETTLNCNGVSHWPSPEWSLVVLTALDQQSPFSISCSE